MNDHEIFELGDVVLQQGATLRDAKLAYETTVPSMRTGAPPSSTQPGTRAGTGRTSG
jgi:hypothetical protein